MTAKELYMSDYNRFPCEVYDAIAISRVHSGEYKLIEDEPETREYKTWDLPITMTEVAKSVMAATKENTPPNEKKLRGL